MESKPTLDELKANVEAAKTALHKAEAALSKFQSFAENNVFSSLEEAVSKLRRVLEYRAAEVCEGAGNCGAEEYDQLFMVGSQKYRMTATVEYNRHDKTYYYIDRFEVEYEAID